MNTIKENYELMAMIRKRLAELGYDERVINDALVDIKRETRRMNRPVRCRDAVRTIRDRNDPESWYDVWALPFQMTPEQEQEYINEFATRICSPYDCTGKPFTRWMHFAKVSDGTTIVIEAKGIDC